MHKKIIVGNWKMNPSSEKEAKVLFRLFSKMFPNKNKNTDVVVCPPFVYIPLAKKELKKSLILGSQTIGPEEKGAYTGEVSSSMLVDLGVRYVIIGHSERRMLGETDSILNKKIKLSLSKGVTPILCVGERDRDATHSYFAFIKEQLEQGLLGINKKSLKDIIIAYEPVWAIGKDALRQATPEECQEIVIYIKKVISEFFNIKNITDIRVLYGGSVDEKNAEIFLKNGGVDGLLVGRASLEPSAFKKIIGK